MSGKPKILFVGEDGSVELPGVVVDSYEVVGVKQPLDVIAYLADHECDGIYVSTKHFETAERIGCLLRSERILEGMPDGVALLNLDNTVVWANERFREWCGGAEIISVNFYEALGNPEILGPDFCPFHTALATGKASSSTLRAGENRYFHVHAAPVLDSAESSFRTSEHLIVTVSDVTAEVLQQQKLEAIHRAGSDLANLTPEEIFDMTVEDRIELLKSNILHYTQDLLNFDVVEIRLLDQATGHLTPLLSYGIDQAAAERALFARPQNNGVTGFVAATGKSYLCEDTQEDPLYIESFKGAKSSLTVPLLWQDQVIGTFNVESPEPRAFTESDLQFLEIFSRDVAVALNTLELLVAQRANTAQESVEAIHSAVALPIDEILNDAVNVMEHYIGHEPEVVERLHRILRNARDIKQVIHRVGERMAPAEAVPLTAKTNKRPKLFEQRVLVVDADESVRNDAHALLDRYGCLVETAHSGDEALGMVRGCTQAGGYNVIIADIRLPDMNGYDLMLRLKQLIDPVPLLMMTGFGYDPGHSIVNARRAGLPPNAVLYKPFRLDQLLETVETILDHYTGHLPQN